MQITLTLDLTAENLDKLKVFCQETGAAPAQAEKKVPATKAAAKTAKAEPKQEAKEEPAVEAPKEEAPAAEETKEENPLTLTDVRAVALKLSKAGKSDVLKDIFKKFGATKLSEVPADKYGELMQELTNA